MVKLALTGLASLLIGGATAILGAQAGMSGDNVTAVIYVALTGMWFTVAVKTLIKMNRINNEDIR